MKRILITVLASFAINFHAYAASDLDFIELLNQQSFKSLSEDLGSATSYRATSPAENLGITGFDIGIEVTSTQVSNADDWAIATSDKDSLDTIIMPKLHIHKGLPFGVDVGASYVSASNTDIELIGAELKVALLKGSTVKPAIALRGTYSQLNGIDQLDMQTTGAEISISKGFAMLTPYVGLGTIWVVSDPKKEAVTIAMLTKEEIQMSKVFAGINLNIALLNLGLEGDKTGDATSYSLKFGLRF